MPLPALIPLVLKAVIASGAIPEVVRALSGSKAADAAEKVVGVARAITGVNDPEMAVTKVIQDPALQIRMQEMLIAERLEYARLEIEDRKDARGREIKTGDKTPRNLAYLVTAGFFGTLAAVMTGHVKPDTEVILILLGSLGTAWTGIIAYYFGSSAGSKAKDDLLKR